MLVAVSALGTQQWQEFRGPEAGLAKILQDVVGAGWPGIVLSAGAVVSIFSVTLVTMYGQTRILFAIGRDGMLPRAFARVNPRTCTPVNNNDHRRGRRRLLAASRAARRPGGPGPIGTLIAFIVVSVGVIILRRTPPDLPRGFRVPGYPVTPVLSIAACLYLIASLSWITLLVFALWVGVVLLFWAFYGARHSRLGAESVEPTGREESP